MPTSVSPGQTYVDMSTAPGADQDWDALFPNPEVQPAQPQAAPGTQPQSQPQAQQPFLKAGDSVYNTAEDAINGVVHKDTEIARMRNFLKANDIDPNTLERVQRVQPQAQTPQTPPQRLFDAVAEAATKRDAVAYDKLFEDFIDSRIRAAVEPWRPTLAETNRFKAVRQVSQEIPDFQKFIESEGFKKVQEQSPLFKDMLAIGENNPEAAQRLPEVYRQMYFFYKGSQPQTSPQPATATPTNPTVRSAPTLQPSSLTPPAPSPNTAGWAQTNWQGAKSLNNEARRQLIQDGDAKFAGMRFEDVSL